MSLILQSQSEWVDDDVYESLSQADTLVGPAAHFWDMHETGSPSAISDIIAGATITSDALAPVAGGIYINCLADSDHGNALAGGVAIGTRDFMLMSVGRSVADPGDADNNGHLGFYWQGVSFTYKIHPYYALVGQSFRTLPYAKNWIRTEGEIYSQALVRRGRYVEHYCLPRGFIDSLDLYNSEADVADMHIDIASPIVTSLGHGGYGTPANNGVGRTIGFAPPWDNDGYIGQDYAGLVVYVFGNGAPSRATIIRALRWCENEWTTKSSGKRLYPGLMGY